MAYRDEIVTTILPLEVPGCNIHLRGNEDSQFAFDPKTPQTGMAGGRRRLTGLVRLRNRADATQVALSIPGQGKADYRFFSCERL